MRRMTALLLAAAAALAPQAARAGCTLSTEPPVLGRYDPTDPGPTATTARVVLSCEAGTAAPLGGAVELSASAGASGNAAERRMSGPDPRGLAYNLYLDAARTRVFGDGTDGTERLVLGGALADCVPSGCPAPISESATIHAAAPTGQRLVPGGYADTIVLRADY